MNDGSVTEGASGPTAESRRDLIVLYGSRTARAFGAGSLAVALALDFATAYNSLLAGVFLALSMVAASVWSLAAERIERAIGRKRTFVVTALGLAVGGLLLFEWLASPYVVLVALLLGGILASSSDIGPLPALEQATLASVVTDRTRTHTFSRYNLLGYAGNAAGALLAAPLTAVGGLFLPNSHDLVLLLYGLIGVSLIPVYLRFSVRADRLPQIEPRRPLSAASRPKILTLSGLFSVDAFGGGLVANFLVTLWLRARYDASAEVIGLVLALAMLGAAISLLLTAPLARRFGLVNTMVFTHMPSSVLLILFAFAPTLGLAAALWVGRSLISQMDVPTRQSFVQAIVAPEERTAAAGYTTAARSTAAAGGPVTGGFLALGGPWLTVPFVLAGGVKVAYDAALYAGFHRVRAPEETATR
ncbi:MAG: MFS transporter [Thermoplasmata archaeon]